MENRSPSIRPHVGQAQRGLDDPEAVQQIAVEELGRALEEYGITSLWLTAALFEQMQARQPEALGAAQDPVARQ